MLAIGLAFTADGERGLIQSLVDGQAGDGLAKSLREALAAAADDGAVEALLADCGQPPEEVFGRLASLLDAAAWEVTEPTAAPGGSA